MSELMRVIGVAERVGSMSRRWRDSERLRVSCVLSLSQRLRRRIKPAKIKSEVSNVQIFGLKNSQASRAAERFFKERRVAIQLVDLKQKPMSAAEIKRFSDRFGLSALLDVEAPSYVNTGMKYLKLSDAEILSKIERDPKLLRLPLVRAGNRLSIGLDVKSWHTMLPTGS